MKNIRLSNGRYTIQFSQTPRTKMWFLALVAHAATHTWRFTLSKYSSMNRKSQRRRIKRRKVKRTEKKRARVRGRGSKRE